MPQSVDEKQKKRGRPATGHDPMYGARLPDDLVKKLDRWARRNKLSRSAAMRHFIEDGLAKE